MATAARRGRHPSLARVDWPAAASRVWRGRGRRLGTGWPVPPFARRDSRSGLPAGRAHRTVACRCHAPIALGATTTTRPTARSAAGRSPADTRPPRSARAARDGVRGCGVWEWCTVRRAAFVGTAARDMAGRE